MTGNLLLEIKGIKNLADLGTEREVFTAPFAFSGSRPGEIPSAGVILRLFFGSGFFGLSHATVTFSATAFPSCKYRSGFATAGAQSQ